MADSDTKSKRSKRREVQVAWAQKPGQGIFCHTLLVEQSVRVTSGSRRENLEP